MHRKWEVNGYQSSVSEYNVHRREEEHYFDVANDAIIVPQFLKSIAFEEQL